jgi:hypothetical protein
MSSSVFLISSDNSVTELKQSEYDSETLFQKLLADHPSLLGMTSGPDGRLLLVRREFGVPEDQGGAERWSLDHLFLDKSGVPVLVEVKRASDTRSRREVVAQMLDYAANGIAYWPIDRIVDVFRETCTAAGGNPDDQLAAFLDGASSEDFWRQVEANLRSGRVRLVFVADKIPKELKRIVEFLNEQMRPAEVLALEMEQFVSPNGMRTLVPKLVGATQRAETAKSVAPRPQAISEAEWLNRLAAARGTEAHQAADQAIQWFRSHGFLVGVTDSQDAVYASLARPTGKQTWPFFIRSSTGRLELSLQYLRNDPAFADDQRRLELLNDMKAIPGVTIATAKLTGWPSIPLSDLRRAPIWDAVQKIALKVKASVEGA